MQKGSKGTLHTEIKTSIFFVVCRVPPTDNVIWPPKRNCHGNQASKGKGYGNGSEEMQKTQTI